MSKEYPLQWPRGWPRTQPGRRAGGNFRTTVSAALTNLRKEVVKIGGKDLIVSSNCTLGQSNPADPGVCAYFTYEGEKSAIPCDRWTRVEANLQAIAKTLESMRGIERWGAKHVVKAALMGFAALPGPGQTSRDWRAVLELDATSTLSDAKANFNKLARFRHPDKGGTHEAMAELNNAWTHAQEALGG